MKTTFVLSALAALAAAGPIDTRQLLDRVGTTENEFSLGGCRDIIFFFARGSSEVGNMGSLVGPPTGQGLKDAFGASRVAVEGVDYAALLSTNALPGGADPAGIREMEGLLDDAVDVQIPSSSLVATGAALTHRAVEDRSAAVKDQIAGVITYGDTQNLQDRGQIPNFPKEKVLIICNPGDLVCSGTLTVLAPHLAYGSRVGEAVRFLTERIRGAGG
ncbi:hypothetical protein PMZ80_009436 [Knufia obscura]|uniref:cutinase n=1 Tax=Knufia obscura TaxID=1635080 RepID=A0ABR0RE00_9EURO|nr:hypothetical protein PMZ80_009436 [Knufia obscura]